MFQAVDDIMIDRVFQPIVNAFRLDPKPVAKNLLAVVIIFGFVMISLLMMSSQTATAVANLVAVLIYIGIWFYFNPPPRSGFGFLRTMLLTICTIKTLLYIAALDTPDFTINLVSIIDHVLIVSILYISVCEKPPPRREKASVWASGMA